MSQNSKDNILSGLNKEQLQAVTYKDGPLLIIAGAGTGKTTVITKRVAWLVLNKLAKTDQILALTFTEKAAQEMEERIDLLLPYGYVDLWVSTFHSFGEKILQQHALDIGLPINFKLLNESQQNFLVQENIDKFNLDYYRPLGNPTKFIQSLVKHFSRAKDELISPEEYLAYAEGLVQNKDSTMSHQALSQEEARLKEVANAYHTYQQLLLDNNALDFGDLINYTLKLFEKRPQILEKYQQQFKYILVDEFQDTNWAQYQLLKMLAKPKNNVTAVSDDDQAVYLFRGASYNNVLQFRKDYPQTKQVVLIKNYRSGQKILDSAYNFIQINNPERLEAQDKDIIKKLKAVKKEKGELNYLHFKTQEDEAKGVGEKIIELKNKDQQATWNDFVILVRANNQAEMFVQALGFMDIPHQFLARRGLFSKPVILDILSYLKLLDNYHEGPALYRVLTSPIFTNRINNEDLIFLTNYAYKKSLSLYETIKKAPTFKSLSSSTQKALEKLLFQIDKHTEMAKTSSVSKVIYQFLEDSGYLKILAQEEKQGEDIFWLNQFFKKVKNFEAVNLDISLPQFMKMIELMINTGDTGSLEAETEEGPEAVKISTIHSAKGLEFKYVFIVNLVDRRFPSIARSEPIELPTDLIKEIVPQGDIHLQEERRLFYVALTRAKQGLYLTSAEDYGGKTIKKTSRFLYELGLTEKQNKGTIKKNKDILEKELSVRKKEKSPLVLPSKFSFSQFIAFKNCPLQYKFAFVYKIPHQGKASLSFGQSMHQTLYHFCLDWQKKKNQKQKKLFNQSVKTELPDFKDLISFYEQCWIDEWYEDKEQKEKYWKKGKEALKLFYQDFIKDPPQIKYLEKKFNFKLGQHPLKGFIDRVDEQEDGYHFIDYKTGQVKKLSKENKEQLLLYQLAAENLPQTFTQPVKKLTFYYLEEGKKESFLGDAAELRELKEKIITTLEKINKKEFPPSPGHLCQYCDFFHICPHRQE